MKLSYPQKSSLVNLIFTKIGFIKLDFFNNRISLDPVLDKSRVLKTRFLFKIEPVTLDF